MGSPDFGDSGYGSGFLVRRRVFEQVMDYVEANLNYLRYFEERIPHQAQARRNLPCVLDCRGLGMTTPRSCTVLQRKAKVV